MAPTPLSASHRLKMLYTVQFVQHVQQNFCDVVGSADPSGFDLLNMRGGTDVGLQTAVDLFFTRIAAFYNPTFTTFDGWVLEVRFGTQFFFTKALAGAPNAPAAESLVADPKLPTTGDRPALASHPSAGWHG